MKKYEERGNRAITLIALVVTIVALLILAAVAIASLSGDNGILKQAEKAREKTQRAQIKEEAEIAKADLIIEASQDVSGTIKTDREGIIRKLEETFKNSYTEGYTVILDNGYEVFVNQKEEIIVRRYEESDTPAITAKHTTEKWRGNTNPDRTGWVMSNLNETDTDNTGVAIPVGFSYLEGDLDTGLVIVNDTTNDEFVWIPVDDICKIIVTFRSKSELKTVKGPDDSIVNINGKIATVEYTTTKAGIYEFYAEDKNGESNYYDVDVGGINLKADEWEEPYKIVYREDITENQIERKFLNYETTSRGYKVEDEKTVLKFLNASLWETWDDAVRGDYFWYSSLEDWYYNCTHERTDTIKNDATEEEMQKAFIEYSNNELGTSAITFEEIKQAYNENYYYKYYGEITTIGQYLSEWYDVNTLEEWYNKVSLKEIIPEELETSIEKYGGFYVGRYEAGSEIIRSRSNGETVTDPIIQKNQYPYNLISQKNAIIACTNYGGKENTTSGLIYGGQWDAIMQYIIDKKALGEDTYNKVTKDSIDWGNYDNSVFPFIGKYSTNAGKTFDDGSTTKNEGNKWLLGTGISEKNKVLNIYDLAGNLEEWTQETYFETYGADRGGNYLNRSVGSSSRYKHLISEMHGLIGFRLMLYL